MSHEPLLALEGLSRYYGAVRALDSVTLRLSPGVIGLVGNNGAGKSTLLKILLGLLPPDAGGGVILGCDLRHASRQLRGQVGYLPEAAATVPVLKGVEYVTLAGDLYGMPHRDAARRAHEVLNYVGLGELRYRRLEEYSAGNAQRLKLAAALVHDPELLLLDEPTNGLDPGGREAMLRLLEDLIAETGKSVVLCTHLLGDIERLCQQVVLLDRGRVAFAGPLEQLQRPSSGRYRLRWQPAAPGDAMERALRQAGLHPQQVAPGEMAVTLPPSSGARALYSLAAAAGVVLAQVRPDEPDLADVLFHLTAEGSAAVRAAEASAATQAVSHHAD